HSVTIFTRGQHPAPLDPRVEQLRGNRDGDLAALDGHSWDAAIDTSGYVPRVVRGSVERLAGIVGHYTFISSISVFAAFPVRGQDESAPLATLADPTVEVVTGETYGALKALCEQAAEAALPGRVLTIRPGLIVGPYDPTDRFTYWPHRIAQGGAVLAPGQPGQDAQFIDARDLAEWIVRMVEGGKTGIYNATGPAAPLTMGALLDACCAVSGGDAQLTWADEDFLLARGVEPWSEMPLWIPVKTPEGEPDMTGHSAVNCAKAIAAGLTFRPLDVTIRDTLAWDATRPVDHEWKAGLKREREAEVLAAWQERQSIH
ncbi:MAG TPA: NAD-dependent epimerase/dehydratase family protein, partial [Ktedonobacterales bacterium]|nr:NAD-dependent epimerase/dehydratase family protein [Ktedonobacterales bacterium]